MFLCFAIHILFFLILSFLSFFLSPLAFVPPQPRTCLLVRLKTCSFLRRALLVTRKNNGTHAKPAVRGTFKRCKCIGAVHARVSERAYACNCRIRYLGNPHWNSKKRIESLYSWYLKGDGWGCRVCAFANPLQALLRAAHLSVAVLEKKRWPLLQLLSVVPATCSLVSVTLEALCVRCDVDCEG